MAFLLQCISNTEKCNRNHKVTTIFLSDVNSTIKNTAHDDLNAYHQYTCNYKQPSYNTKYIIHFINDPTDSFHRLPSSSHKRNEPATQHIAGYYSSKFSDQLSHNTHRKFLSLRLEHFLTNSL